MTKASDPLENTIVSLIRKAVTKLPQDVTAALENALKTETNEIAKTQLRTILENIKLAKTLHHPICQDTGTLTFFVEVGYDFPFIKKVKTLIVEAVIQATKGIPLRSNTVDPFTGRNTGTNIGRHLPWIDWSLIDGDYCKITVLPKGGGSENGSTFRMFNPTVELETIKRFIIEHVIQMGGKPCPPTIVGIGIGGGADISMKLAKKSLLRPIGNRNRDKTLAKLEKELMQQLNQTGIGPMGLGGNTTVLDVHIETAHRHPASFPVGVVMQCWANRRAAVTITKDGETRWD
ncbi:MAG TPA: fumarate hydratase [Thermoplasmata archaeon]|nr:fumarate hydratase [Thermoplasmata archaeon]